MAAYICAEGGVNHGGSYDEALRLIECAKRTGADAVKFQLFDYRLLKRPELQRFQLSHDEIGDLSEFARSMEIDFLCTPFDETALDYIAALNPRYMKLASGAVFNEGLLAAAAKISIPIVLSTGMASMEEVAMAVEMLPEESDLTLAHTTSAYPAPISDANLRAITALRTRFMTKVGYSDHTVMPEAVLAAVALGASYIEMHITRDRGQTGPDHLASYEPALFLETVLRVRNVETMLGDGIKRPQPSEKATREVWAA